MFKNIFKCSNNKIKHIKAVPNNTDGPICLSDLECGNCAKIIKLHGSNHLVCKLKAMGICAGTVIEKKSAIPSKGPIIVERCGTQLALGYDIAERITVERI